MSALTQPTLYFTSPGPQNTAAVVEAVKERCAALGIEHVVVASNTGATAEKFWEALHGSGVTLVWVTEHVGFSGGDQRFHSLEKCQELAAKGVQVLTCSHALSGVSRSITNKFGGVTPVEIIAHTLRLFGQGVKVAVEIAVMAADAGLIPTDRDVIAVGGTGRGADAALVLQAAHQNNFFDQLRIREIIAMPR